MTYKLPDIEKSYIPKVLLLGNGINKSFNRDSWDEMLKNIKEENITEQDLEIIKNLPYPLQAVAITKDQVDKKLEDFSEELVKIEITDEQQSMIRSLLECNFDAILTTNYTYEIEKSIDPEFSCKPKSRCKCRKKDVIDKYLTSKEKQYGLYRYMHLEKSDKQYNIWHIHGEAARPESMVLGHYYYGKLLSTVQNVVSKYMKKYHAKSEKIRLQNWVDYFLMGDVYILGFGLDLSEMDIWWLINCKKRNNPEGKVYYIEPNMDLEKNVGKKVLLQTYGVEIITELVNDGEYRDYYNRMIDFIKEKIKD